MGGSAPESLVAWQWINLIFLKDMAATCSIYDAPCRSKAVFGWGLVSAAGFVAFYSDDE